MAYRGQDRNNFGISENRSFLLNGYIIGEQRIKKLYLKWILGTTIVLLMPIGQFYRCFLTFYYPEYGSISRNVNYISMLLNLTITLTQAIIIFRLNWDYFWSYIDSLELLNIPSYDKLRKQIQRKRIVKIFMFASILLIYKAPEFIYTPWHYNRFTIIFHLARYVGHFFIFIILIDICICLQAAFESVNKQIVSCCYNNKQRLLLKHLLYYRQCWFHALEATQSAEKFLRHYVTFFYVRFAVHTVLNQIHLFHHLKSSQFSDVFYFLIVTFTNAILVWYITANMIAVNTFSQNSLEELYELTFKTDSIILEQQIYMFLDQISKTDAGFTFGNLFLIAPNFITSFFTLTLTITIAFLSYL
ncbi:uncharacterized protein LOC107372044 [Tetranychus urticae]|uniref:Gustatory receptor n=1 Tax=Tetranychus urticae TaxID=32264 RepID=T1JZK5_TETUR|nr:uncharacterized protein LOC107372044 [Tetranychus urticae]